MYSKLLFSGATASNSWIWKIRFVRLAESLSPASAVGRALDSKPTVKGSSPLWGEVTFLLLIFLKQSNFFEGAS